MNDTQPNHDNSGRDETPGPDELKRDFLKRFGGYAATAPVALYLLMSPKTSAAAGTDSAP